MVDGDYPPNIRQEMIALRSRSAALLSVSDEGAVAQRSAGAELRAAEARLDAPLLIIAAEKSDVPDLPVGAFERAEKALSERKPNSRYVLVHGATHYIQAGHPRDVVEALMSWLPGLS